MIVIGFRGVGKTTYCKKHSDAIDLSENKKIEMFPDIQELYKSKNCKFNEFQDTEEFTIEFCKIVAKYSNEGKIIFLRDEINIVAYLLDFVKQEDIVLLSPSYDLEDEWIEKLKRRYENDTTNELSKDAYEDTIGNYKIILKTFHLLADAYGLSNDIIITSIDYNFEEIIEKIYSCLKDEIKTSNDN